jgi:hypothetical protein
MNTKPKDKKSAETSNVVGLPPEVTRWILNFHLEKSDSESKPLEQQTETDSRKNKGEK